MMYGYRVPAEVKQDNIVFIYHYGNKLYNILQYVL